MAKLIHIAKGRMPSPSTDASERLRVDVCQYARILMYKLYL